MSIIHFLKIEYNVIFMTYYKSVYFFGVISLRGQLFSQRRSPLTGAGTYLIAFQWAFPPTLEKYGNSITHSAQKSKSICKHRIRRGRKLYRRLLFVHSV